MIPFVAHSLSILDTINTASILQLRKINVLTLVHNINQQFAFFSPFQITACETGDFVCRRVYTSMLVVLP